MNAPSSFNTPYASDVQQAAAITSIAGVMQAAEMAGGAAHQLDCTALAHNLRPEMGGKDCAASSLEADLLDVLLRLRPSNAHDVAVLALVAAHRIEVVFDRIEDGYAQTVCGAISVAIDSLAAAALRQLDGDPVPQMPEPLRGTALNVLGWDTTTANLEV